MVQRERALYPQLSPAAFFGVRLRTWRQDRGISQAELGRRVHVSGDLISKIEKAERRATPDLVARVDDALATGGDLLRAGEGLHDAGFSGAGFPGAGMPPGKDAAPGPASDEALPPVLSGLREILTGCRLLDHSLGSRAVTTTIATQTAVAESLLPGCRAEHRGDLLDLLAQLHQLSGWLAFDQGHLAAAGREFTTAAGYARSAGSPNLMAYVLGPSHGFALTYGGSPQAGVHYGQAALDQALRSDSPRLTAFVRATTARAHALLGESRAALTLLDQAQEDLGGVDAAERVPDWLTVFDTAALHGHRGSCLLDLGRSALAVEELAAQEGAAPSHFARNRMIWLLDRSRAHLDQHDLQATCRVLDRLVPQTTVTTSRRIRARVLACCSMLAPHRGNREVAGLLDRLHGPRTV